MAPFGGDAVVLELARRHHREEFLSGPSLTDPRRAQDFLRTELRDLDYESFCLIFLDSRYRVTSFEPMFRGTVDCAQVHPREVVRRALEVRASSVILAHNHPSGMAEPSDADHVITRRLREALPAADDDHPPRPPDPRRVATEEADGGTQHNGQSAHPKSPPQTLQEKTGSAAFRDPKKLTQK